MLAQFKEKLNGEGVIGFFSKTADPAFIEAMGYAGGDFVIIDLEHGPNTIQTAQNLIRAAEVSGIFPIIRVKEENNSVMGEALDIGALGIQVPQVCSKEDAENVRKHTKFAPLGERGVCRFVRAADYSAKDRFEYFKDANEAVTVLQIEGKEGIENLSEVLETGCADVIFIGPYDLSQSLGIPGQIDNPLVEKQMLKIVEACKEKGVAVGTFTDTIANARKWQKLGVKYIAHSVDVGIFCDAVKKLVNDIKSEE
ncbi:MAG: aldolase [Oscillospiraceae bacterium]|nr:aldolase [Oscillospiraceae bacterium]